MLLIRGLAKRYGENQALVGLDLNIASGEVLALLGKNGAGKSTAVKCLVGLVEPDRGSIRLGDVDVLANAAAARAQIGYLPEVARLYESLTPSEYLRLKGRLFDLDEGQIRARSERLLAGFDLSDRANEPMAAFSKGMLQKVSLSAALLTQPRLLVLDEPLSGLDVAASLVVKEVVREFARRGGAVLYCSHQLEVVAAIAHRIAVLDQGQLVASGTAAELRAQAGSDAGSTLDSVFRTLVKASDPLHAATQLLGDPAN